MNKNTLLPLLAASAFTLAGCGKKEQPPVPPAPQTPPPAAATAQPSALDSAKQTAADVGAQARKAGQQLADQGKQVATQVADQAKTAVSQVSDKAKTVVAQAKDGAESFADQFKKPATAPSGPTDYTALAQKVSDSAKSLLANPVVSQPMKDQLTKLTASVLANKDGDASGALAQIVALKPSDDQMGVVKELQSNFAVLALGRNFDANDPASGSAVTQTIGAIKSGDVTSAVAGLRKVGASAKLTDAQKGIVTNLVSSYGGALAGVTDKREQGRGRAQGLRTLISCFRIQTETRCAPCAPSFPPRVPGQDAGLPPSTRTVMPTARPKTRCATPCANDEATGDSRKDFNGCLSARPIMNIVAKMPWTSPMTRPRKTTAIFDSGCARMIRCV